MSFNPNVQSGGTAYAWVSATITYTGDPVNIDMHWGPVDFPLPCARGVNNVAAGGGTVTIKQYCSFDVDTGDLFRVYFNTGKGCVNELIQSVDATLKFTFIQVVEPP